MPSLGSTQARPLGVSTRLLLIGNTQDPQGYQLGYSLGNTQDPQGYQLGYSLGNTQDA
jgi:hypothetical protein